MSETVLILEDEEDIIEGLTFVLEDEGYKVHSYTSGINALKDIKSCNPDIILLDLMLPDINGLDVCTNLKNNIETANIPILIISSKSTEQEIIQGINCGCNDYITKPFSEKVLLAKIKSHLKMAKQQGQNSKIIKFKNLTIKSDNYEAFLDGSPLGLTPTEFKVLHSLMEKMGTVQTREKIIEYIDPNYEKIMSLKSIDIIITRIRKKINGYSKYIESVYGIGYKFKKEIESNILKTQ
jgi:two-component system phosphate regulon response regulator PhoB